MIDDDTIQNARLDCALESLERGESPPDLVSSVLARAAAERRAPPPARRQLQSAALWLALGIGLVVAVWASARLGSRAEKSAQDPTPVETDPIEVSTEDQVRALPDTCRAVRGLALDSKSIAGLDRLRKLRRLELRGPGWVPRDEVLKPTPLPTGALGSIAKLTELRVFKLVGYDALPSAGIAMLRTLPQLEELEIRDAAPKPGVLESVTQLPRLRRLAIDGARFMTAEFLEQLSDLPLLESLTLVDVSPELEATEWHALAALRSLRELTLQSGRPLTLRRVDQFEPTGFGLKHAQFDDAVCEHLASLPKLRDLTLLNWPELTDAGLAEFQDCDALHTLRMTSCDAITDACLDDLPPELRTLSLVDCGQIGVDLPPRTKLHELEISCSGHLDDVEIAKLVAWPNLRALRLSVVPTLTSASIESISQMKNLEELEFDGATWLDDEDLAQLAPLTELRRLSFRGYNFTSFLGGFEGTYGGLTSVTGRGVAGLARFPKLAELDLAYIQRIAAADLRALSALPLRKLNLDGTEVAFDEKSTDLATLLHAWPDCEVTHAPDPVGRPGESRHW